MFVCVFHVSAFMKSADEREKMEKMQIGNEFVLSGMHDSVTTVCPDVCIGLNGNILHNIRLYRFYPTSHY